MNPGYPAFLIFSSKSSTSFALYTFTLRHNFSLMLTYHTQGRVIFYEFQGNEPPESKEIVEEDEDFLPGMEDEEEIVEEEEELPEIENVETT